MHDSKEKLSSNPKAITLEKITGVEQLKDEQAFEVCLKKGKHVFRCEEPNEVTAWIKAFQQIQRKNMPADSDRTSVISEGLDNILIDDNMLYESLDAPPMFSVQVEQNDDATRYNLLPDKEYLLAVNKYNLALHEKPSKQILFQWPYQYIRRFGRTPGLFHIFSGRKCLSGAADFNLLTQEGDAIFDSIRKFTVTMRNHGADEIQDSKDHNVQASSQLPVAVQPSPEAAVRSKGHFNTMNSVNSQDFKECNEMPTGQSPGINETKLLFKGCTENQTIGEVHHGSQLTPSTNSQTQKSAKEKKKAKDCEKKENKERKQLKKKEKKKGKDKDLESSKSNPNIEPSPLYEELDESPIPSKPIPKPRQARASTKLYDTIDENIGPRSTPCSTSTDNLVSKSAEAVNPYSDPVELNTKKETTVYSQPEGLRSDAWKQYGQNEAENVHVEDYINIRMAATLVADKERFSVPQDEDEEDTYDSLSKPYKTTNIDSNNIYGISSGKLVDDIPGQSASSSGYEEPHINVVVRALKSADDVLVLSGNTYPKESSDYEEVK